MRYSSILTVILWLTCVIPASASVVLQNSAGAYSGTGLLYDAGPNIEGIGQIFTASSTFTIESIDAYFYVGGSQNGCVRGHIWSVVAGVPTTDLGQSDNCINVTTYTGTYSTSTFSFIDIPITSGNDYMLSFEGESLSLGSYPPDITIIANSSVSYGNVCSITAGVWSCAVASNIRFVAYDTGGIDTSTHIIEVLPENGTTTSNPVTFSLSAYVNLDDLGPYNPFDLAKIRIVLHNIDQNVLWGTGWLSPNDIVLYDDYATTTGYFYYATTTTVGEGNYRIHAELTRHFLIDGTVYDEVDNQFIVGQSTFIGNISQNSWNALQGIYASTSATSTAALADSCTPWSTDFDTVNCLAFVFIPDAGLINDSLTNLKDNVLTRFPLGYVTDFVSIMSTSSTSTLIFFNFTTPSGFRFAPVTFTFDAYRSMDWFLYATTTAEWNSAGAISEQTWFEITNGYWTYIVYAGLLFYMLRRILGKDIIPKFNDI